MPRITIARQTASLAGLELETTAADVDGIQFQNNENQLLFVDNGGGTAVTVTVEMADDQYGRSGTKTVSVPAGEQRFIGPFPATPYNQDGLVLVDFSAVADVDVAVLSLRS